MDFDGQTPLNANQRAHQIISDLHLGMSSSVLENAGQLLPLLRDNTSVIFNGDSVEIHFVNAARKVPAMRPSCVKSAHRPARRPIF